MAKSITIKRLRAKIEELPDSPKVPRWKKQLAELTDEKPVVRRRRRSG